MKQMRPPLWLGGLVLGMLMAITGCLSGMKPVGVVSTSPIDNPDLGERAATASSVPAFPGAEGFGAKSVGGRGGRVIEVTNLNDSGNGSLRACIEASGPRTCVFRAGGTITLYSRLTISNPYITIAGQTAPGGGIALKNDPSHSKYTIQIDTHDVIIRYLRIRPGPSRSFDSSTSRALTMFKNSSYNIMIDHCSFSWATDEIVSTWYNAHDVTIQWSIISESLHCSTHSEGCHSKGPLFGSDGSHNISFHHNLMAHNRERNPTIKVSGIVDIVNNVAYLPTTRIPYSMGASPVVNEYDPQTVNYVGNYFKWGANNQPGEKYYISTHHYTSLDFDVFVKGNIGPNRPRNDMTENLVVMPEDRDDVTRGYRHDAPPVTTYSCHSLDDCEVYNQVLDNAGAILPMRDAVDKRIVEEVKRGEGRIIDAPSEERNYNPIGTEVLAKSDYTKYGINDPLDFEGWPVLAAGTPYPDSDHDGMPDEWEHLYCLNPSDPSDGPFDADGDGYTNVEEYLNGTEPSSICTRPFLPLGVRCNPCFRARCRASWLSDH